MPTVVTGYRSTGVGILADRRVLEMENRIYQYDPNKTPFLTILSQNAEAVVTGNPKFLHMEDEPLPAWDTLTANLSSGASTTQTVANGAYFRPGDLVLIPTSLAGGKAEVALVSSVATNTLTWVRDWVNNNAGVGGTAALSGANIVIIGNVNEEGSTSRTLKSTTEAEITNYCQIIKTPVGATETLDASNLYGGGDRTYQRQRAATQHAFEQERAFLFGTKRETTGANGHFIRATGGVIYWLSTNSVSAGGTLTHSTIETLAQKVFRYGSDTKLFLVSRLVMSQLDNIAEGRLETVPSADTYGVKMRRYVTGHGDFMIKVHDMLINDFSGYGIVIDMENVTKRYMKGRLNNFMPNIQGNDEDAWKDHYLSEIGLHIHLEKAHGLLTGVA